MLAPDLVRIRGLFDRAPRALPSYSRRHLRARGVCVAPCVRTRLTFTNVGPDWRIGFAAGVASRLYWVSVTSRSWLLIPEARLR